MYNKNVPDVSVTITDLLQGEVKGKPHKNTDINKTLIKNSRYMSFLVVDTRSVETTIAVGQNMQMCHSLRCKQIDRSTGTQLISIQ